MSNLVSITLHGDLGNTIPPNWNLAVKSVGEAMRAIETHTKKLYKYLLEKDKEGIKYRVLLNGMDFVAEEQPKIEKPETILKSELVAKRNNLKSIDIIPVIEGADSKGGGIGMTILGAILIVIGIIAISTPIGAPLIVLGIGLLVGGIALLVAQPPKFEDFREIDSGGKVSYLFSGPENIVGEGGPVPIGYGKMLVGSQVISSAYVVYEVGTKGQTLSKWIAQRSPFYDVPTTIPTRFVYEDLGPLYGYWGNGG